MSCPHREIDGGVQVARVSAVRGGRVSFVAHVALKCLDCGEVPTFRGVAELAPSLSMPTAAHGRQELRAPFSFGPSPALTMVPALPAKKRRARSRKARR